MAVLWFLSGMTEVLFFAGGSGSYRNLRRRNRRKSGGSEGKHMKVSTESG